MKRIIILSLLIILSNIAFCQTISITGKITDDKGNPVAFAFIKDAKHNYQTFSGPDGTFILNADPASRLMVTCSNYKKNIVEIKNNSQLDIVIMPDANGGINSAAVAKSSDAFDVHEIGGTDRAARPLTQFGTAREQLHGSPFLFDNWVHGYAISPQDSIIESNNYLFNYEKIEGVLLYTDDGKTMYSVYKDKARKFVLFDENGQESVFESVPAIDDKHYVQVLSEGRKYKIYKQLNTIFTKADFQTNGITSTGNNYDSYVDESVYYVVKLPNGQPQKISLRKKTLKTAFADDAAEVNKFMSDHDDAEVDDSYLKKLGDALNNN